MRYLMLCISASCWVENFRSRARVQTNVFDRIEKRYGLDCINEIDFIIFNVEYETNNYSQQITSKSN